MCWLQQSAQLWYYPTFLLYPLAVIAIVECFAGYYAWRFLVGLNGAIAGFIGGAMLGAIVGGAMLALVGALLGALAGVALFAGIAPVGNFIFAFATVASFSIFLGRVTNLAPPPIMALAVIFGVGSALLAIALCRPAMIVIASLAGAQQIASAYSAYRLPYDLLPTPDILAPSELVAFLTLAVLGLSTQFATWWLMHGSKALTKPV